LNEKLAFALAEGPGRISRRIFLTEEQGFVLSIAPKKGIKTRA